MVQNFFHNYIVCVLTRFFMLDRRISGYHLLVLLFDLDSLSLNNNAALFFTTSSIWLGRQRELFIFHTFTHWNTDCTCGSLKMSSRLFFSCIWQISRCDSTTTCDRCLCSFVQIMDWTSRCTDWSSVMRWSRRLRPIWPWYIRRNIIITIRIFTIWIELWCRVRSFQMVGIRFHMIELCYVSGILSDCLWKGWFLA